MSRVIRTTNLSLANANQSKKDILNLFMDECIRAYVYYLDAYWQKYISGNNYTLDSDILEMKYYANNGKFVCQYPPLNIIPDFTDSKVSARTLKSIKTQVFGQIKAALAKRRKNAWRLKKLQREGKDSKNLQKTLNETPLVKPGLPKTFSFEFNSINCSLSEPNQLNDNGEIKGKSYDLWFSLQSMFNKETSKELGLNKLSFPLKHNRHSRKMESKGAIMTSFLVSREQIGVRYELNEVVPRNKTRILSIDQGIATPITGVFDNDQQLHLNEIMDGKHTMKSIISEMENTVKGTEKFRKLQDLRINYVNWLINQINFYNIAEIRLEDLKNMRRGKKSSRFLSHFTYTLIADKLRARCEEEGVLFTLVPNEYRSQRCFSCGFVLESNRRSKSFACKSYIGCDYTADADVNAARNLGIDLPLLDRWYLQGLNRNKGDRFGFFWVSEFEGAYSPFKPNKLHPLYQRESVK